MRRDREDELRRLYRAHVDDVFAFFAFSVSRTHAEDLTSATFERVIRSWRSYDASKASERTWILAIARNLLTDHFRRQGHRDAASLDEHPELADAVWQRDELERRLDEAEVRSWLMELPERDREIVSLRYGADLTGREIARIHDLTEANVHQILSRSVRRLRAEAQRTRAGL